MTAYPQESVMPYGGLRETKVLEVERMFDHISRRYDRLNHALSLGIDRYWRDRAIRILRPFRPRHILDVATGTGDFALLTCQELHPDALMGIDISEGMMAVARSKARQAGLNNRLTFHREDCSQLTFADGSFDAVTVAFGVRNFQDLDRCLNEMSRVLIPGGHLVILELSTPVRLPMRQAFDVYSRWLIPLMGQCMASDRQAYNYLNRSIRAFPQGEVMQDIIQRAGFSRVDFLRLTGGICTLYIAEK